MSRSGTFSLLGGVVVSCVIAAGCDGTPSAPSSVGLTGISPSAGSMLGGTRLTISGWGFKSGAKLVIGSTVVEANVESERQITAIAPAHAPGKVNVIVTNPGGQSGSRIEAYTFEVDPPFVISGTVTELTDKGESPVEGVLVEVDGTNISALTDASGAYRLAGLRRVDFSISMSKSGYDTITVPVTASSDMQLNQRINRLPVLSGVVFEATPSGRVPLDGVVLYCDACGSPVGHTFVTTDANGRYSFEWTRNGPNWIQFISKDGYKYAGPLTEYGILVNVNGNTKFDIELVKR